MLISFFEEFPTKSNLEKIKLVNWPTKLYLAAKSLRQFNSIQSKLNYKNITEFIYWPLLELKEGYWISSFSQRAALKRIFNELKKTSTSVMLDLELPTTKNPTLYLTQLFNFYRNRSLIKKFIQTYPGKIYLAEYYPQGKIQEKMFEFLGLHYQSEKVKVIKMFYHSLHNFSPEFLNQELKRGKLKLGDNYLAAYGTIARGIGGNEPLLSSKKLTDDLETAAKAGVKEVVIFRLGGLNNIYVKVLRIFRTKLS